MFDGTGGSWPTIPSHCTCPNSCAIACLCAAPQPGELGGRDHPAGAERIARRGPDGLDVPVPERGRPGLGPEVHVVEAAHAPEPAVVVDSLLEEPDPARVVVDHQVAADDVEVDLVGRQLREQHQPRRVDGRARQHDHLSGHRLVASGGIDVLDPLGAATLAYDDPVDV